jgi:hypothetical protein
MHPTRPICCGRSCLADDGKPDQRRPGRRKHRACRPSACLGTGGRRRCDIPGDVRLAPARRAVIPGDRRIAARSSCSCGSGRGIRTRIGDPRRHGQDSTQRTQARRVGSACHRARHRTHHRASNDGGAVQPSPGEAAPRNSGTGRTRPGGRTTGTGVTGTRGRAGSGNRSTARGVARARSGTGASSCAAALSRRGGGGAVP